MKMFRIAIFCIPFFYFYIPVFSTPVNVTPSYLFSISVKDHTGRDISDRTAIFHNQSPSLQTLDNKRSLSRAANICPPNQRYSAFWYSQCNRSVSPQAYSVVCLPPENEGGLHAFEFRIFDGHCAPSEFCVDSHLDGQTSTAFCISGHDFFLYAQKKTTEANTVGSASLGIPATDQPSYAVEALLTASNLQKSIFAASLNIQAQRIINVHGTPLWQPLGGGTNQCSNCASIGLDAVPDGTQRFSVNAVLPAGVSASEIWLTSWRP